MPRTFHFISGLPRSGSTLLAAILRQNPRFHASMSSPLAELVGANLQLMSPGSEAALLMTEGQRRQVLRGLFESFYADMAQDRMILDTNRAWTARLPLLSELYPGARVIACVRDLRWVMDSLERIIRKHPFHNSRLFGRAADRATVYSRVEALARPDSLVGFSWAALKEAFYGEQADRLLIIDYALLAKAPRKVLPLVYDFLGEPRYDGHDFENVTFDADDFDEALGLSGLHKVRSRVEYIPRRTVLPPDLFRKYENMDFWHDLTGSNANVIAAERSAETDLATV